MLRKGFKAESGLPGIAVRRNSRLFAGLSVAALFLSALTSVGRGPGSDALFFVRETLALLGCVFAFLWASRNESFTSAGVTERLRWLLLGQFGLLFGSLFPQGLLEGVGIPDPTVFFVAHLLFLVVGTFVAAAMWLNFRELVFVRRTRSTARNFAALSVSGAGYVLLRYLSTVSGVDLGHLQSVVLLLAVLFAVVNGFRQGWIHQLYRRQKIASFWASAFVFGLGLAASKLAGERLAQQMAPVVSGLAVLTATVTAVYGLMAAIGLLLSLPSAKAYDRRSRGLASLQRLTGLVSSILDVDELVKVIPRLAAEVTEGDAAWLELRRNGRLRVVSSVRAVPGDLESRLLDLEDGASGLVLKRGSTVLAQQAWRDARVADIHRLEPRWQSVAAVPVASKNKVHGVLYVVSYQPFAFAPDDTELLEAFGNQSGVALENARLVRESIERQRLQEELRVAREAQRKLLPAGPLKLSGVELRGVCLTANDVGGDYYDYFLLDEHRVGVVIADVAGKGASAAFYMAETKGVVETLARQGLPPRQVLVEANAVLSSRMDRRTFVSVIYAVLDLARAKVTFARAGHSPLLHTMVDGTVRFLEPRGVALGMARGPEFGELTEEVTFSVLPGETLLFFTDGLTEARNARGEEFEEGRLSQLLSQLHGASVEQTTEAIVGEVRKFVGPKAARHDDLTFVVVRFTDEGAQTATLPG